MGSSENLQSSPIRLTTDGTNLFIADRFNNLILYTYLNYLNGNITWQEIVDVIEVS